MRLSSQLSCYPYIYSVRSFALTHLFRIFVLAIHPPLPPSDIKGTGEFLESKPPTRKEVMDMRKRIGQATAQKTTVMTPEEYAKVDHPTLQCLCRYPAVTPSVPLAPFSLFFGPVTPHPPPSHPHRCSRRRRRPGMSVLFAAALPPPLSPRGDGYVGELQQQAVVRRGFDEDTGRWR